MPEEPKKAEGKKEESRTSKDVMAKQELLAKSEISLILDTYDDIFSDFDPRPYEKRALSDDFLQEAKRASREIKPGVLELRFLMPAAERKPHLEAEIIKRLHAHFKKHAHRLKEETKKITQKGVLIVALGLIMLMISAFILSKQSGFFFKLIFVVLEPAGWFAAWYGLEAIFYGTKEKSADLRFYQNMSRAEISFNSY